VRKVRGCVKRFLPPAAAEYYIERHIIFEISLREISKMMCRSKDYLARSAVKNLFTQLQPFYTTSDICLSSSRQLMFP
jgi:hypothetical protein